jgi:tetratricopeptide (TPR) repeat protein
MALEGMSKVYKGPENRNLNRVLIKARSRRVVRLALVAILSVSFALLNLHHLRDSLFCNLGMSWTLRYLASDGHVLEEDELESIADSLDRQNQPVASRFSAPKVLLGNLYWTAGDETSAKQYWMDGGADSDFFIGMAGDIAQETSLDYIDRAISLSPTRSELLYYKGLYYETSGDGETASYWYALAEMQDNWLDPALSFRVFYEHGALLFQREQWQDAQRVLLRAEGLSTAVAIDSKRELAMVHRWLGLLYQQQGDLRVAHTHFLQAIELYPQDYWNYLSLALIAEAENQSPETVFWYFDQARIAAPSAVYAYVYPAQHYLGLNQREQWQYFCERTPWYLREEQQWLDVCRSAP